jgi:hypothetical protein
VASGVTLGGDGGDDAGHQFGAALEGETFGVIAATSAASSLSP